MRAFLIPKVGFGRWSGDGLHCTRDNLTCVDGRVIEFSWLGLHVEFVVAVERPL